LPKFRVSEVSAFGNVGFDYLGPLYVVHKEITQRAKYGSHCSLVLHPEPFILKL